MSEGMFKTVYTETPVSPEEVVLVTVVGPPIYTEEELLSHGDALKFVALNVFNMHFEEGSKCPFTLRLTLTKEI